MSGRSARMADNLTAICEPSPRPTIKIFFGSAGNRTLASGSVAKNSDHWTTEAVKIVPILN
jgi:hypothetical protein